MPRLFFFPPPPPFFFFFFFFFFKKKLFGRKSEKSAAGDRSNDLFDPDEATATAKKRGADQPGHAGHPHALRRLLAAGYCPVPLAIVSSGKSRLADFFATPQRKS